MDKDPTDRLIWIDVETTGLDPARHALLEVAVIVTEGGLRELMRKACVIPCNEHDMRVLNLNADQTAREMHETSGLWAEVQQVAAAGDALPLPEADALIARDLALFTEPGACPLAGSSVHFDRAFLAHHMPRVHAHLHYRNLDVSSLFEAARRWAPGVAEDAPGKRGIHRAMPDLEDSLNLARYLRGAVFAPEHATSPRALRAE